MPKSTILRISILVLLMGMLIPFCANAQSRKLPAKMRLVGTVNYDFGAGRAKAVNCYLSLKLSGGKVSGTTNYQLDYNDQPSELTGTYKANKNGTYHLDVWIMDNSGCDFEGTYDPKTGIFSGQFSGRGMYKTYPFKFRLSK